MGDSSLEQAEIVVELRHRIESGVEALRETVPSEFHGGAVLELLRSMDQAQVYMEAHGEWPKMWRERVRYGTVRALALFVPGAATKRQLQAHFSTPKHAVWAGSTLLDCGTLSLADMVVDAAASGLLQLQKTGADQYHGRVASPNPGVEALERLDLAWWRDRIATMQAPEEEELASIEPRIHARLVRAMRRGGVGISSTDDPEVDDHFEARAVLHAERLLGYDYFPNEARLGGLDFFTYKCAVVFLLRWVLRDSGILRVQFRRTSTALGSSRARDALVSLLPRQEVVDHMAGTLLIGHAEASQIIDMLTLDPDFAMSSYPKVPSAANPPFVTVGGDHLARSLHGCLNAPFQFLLSRLRSAHPDDWRTAANLTEAVFREELYSLFPEDRFLRVARGIELKADGRVLTDVDAFALDRETGVAGLFQLKWWFPYGSSMRARSSGAKNMAVEAARWTERVQTWLGRFGLPGLAHQAGLRRADRNRLRRVQLFLIGRTFAHFSGAEPVEDGVARGTWQQVLRLSAAGIPEESPIDWLWEALQKDSPLRRTPPVTGQDVLDARDFSILLDATGAS